MLEEFLNEGKSFWNLKILLPQSRWRKNNWRNFLGNNIFLDFFIRIHEDTAKGILWSNFCRNTWSNVWRIHWPATEGYRVQLLMESLEVFLKTIIDEIFEITGRVSKKIFEKISGRTHGKIPEGILGEGREVTWNL